MNWKDKFPKESRYFETESGILYCADAVQLLKEFPDGSCNLLITDPPYFLSRGEDIVGKYVGRIILNPGDWDNQWQTEEEYFQWVERWFKECLRVLDGEAWMYVFFGKRKIGIFNLFASKYGVLTRTIFVWVKTNPPPSVRKFTWISSTELVWVGSKTYNRIKNFLGYDKMFDYFVSSNSSSCKETKHPTEKPKSLIARFILASSYEGEIVIDPFFGSGTLAVVCEELNRKWIGIEINEEYCEIAKKRILEEMRHRNLFKK